MCNPEFPRAFVVFGSTLQQQQQPKKHSIEKRFPFYSNTKHFLPFIKKILHRFGETFAAGF
jgi:hypothetical protein